MLIIVHTVYKVMWTDHAFLNEELGSLQGTCHVLTKSLALLFVQHLGVEGTDLQENNK